MPGPIIFLDQSNDGVFADIGRLVIVALKNVSIGYLSLELTSFRVEGYNVSNHLIVFILTPCDDNFSRVEWRECRILEWKRDIS